MSQIEVYDPTGKWRQRQLSYATRPLSLADSRLGVVENGKHNSDTLLIKLAKILVAAAGVKGYRIWRKHSPSHPAWREVLNEVAESCDLAICGVGD